MEPFQFSKWPILTEWLAALFHSTLFAFSQARLSHNLTTQYLQVHATKYTFRYIHPLSEYDSDLTYMRFAKLIYFHSRLFYVPQNELILEFTSQIRSSKKILKNLFGCLPSEAGVPPNQQTN